MSIGPVGGHGVRPLRRREGARRAPPPIRSPQRDKSGSALAKVIRSSSKGGLLMKSNRSVVFAAMLGVLLLATTALAVPPYRADRISTQGTITNVTRVGDQYQITLNHGAYMYSVPV